MKMLRLSGLAVLLLANLDVHSAYASLSRGRQPGSSLSRTPEPNQRRVFEGNSAGWYWIYEGVAQAQSFIAAGSKVDSLCLRVAQLNNRQPTAPLEVEIRDWRLRKIYARGVIRTQQAGRDFRWAEVKFNHQAPLEKGRSYTLLLSSPHTPHHSPWVVNAIYKDLYPGGRHLGYEDALFFSITFSNGAGIHVGPGWDRNFDRPINSGHPGGPPMQKPLALYVPRSPKPVTADDPIGPIPAGIPIAASE